MIYASSLLYSKLQVMTLQGNIEHQTFYNIDNSVTDDYQHNIHYATYFFHRYVCCVAFILGLV